MGIPILKIRRSRYRLIFNKGNTLLVRRHIYFETVPRMQLDTATDNWSKHSPDMNAHTCWYMYFTPTIKVRIHDKCNWWPNIYIWHYVSLIVKCEAFFSYFRYDGWCDFIAIIVISIIIVIISIISNHISVLFWTSERHGAPDGPHVGPMKLAIRDISQNKIIWT